MNLLPSSPHPPFASPPIPSPSSRHAGQPIVIRSPRIWHAIKQHPSRCTSRFDDRVERSSSIKRCGAEDENEWLRRVITEGKAMAREQGTLSEGQEPTWTAPRIGMMLKPVCQTRLHIRKAGRGSETEEVILQLEGDTISTCGREFLQLKPHLLSRVAASCTYSVSCCIHRLQHQPLLLSSFCSRRRRYGSFTVHQFFPQL